MADKLASEAELAKEKDDNASFLSETLEESELEFEDNDELENREHEDGDGADEIAAAKTDDAELATLGKGDEAALVPPTDGLVQPPPVPSPETPPADGTPASEEAKAAETPPTEQASATPPATDPNLTGGQPTPDAPPASAEEISLPSQEDIQQTYTAWRGQAENLLAEHYYALTPEVQAELEIEPAKVIPRLMAKTYLDAMTASIGQMTMHFPRMVRLVLEQFETEDSTEKQFFDRWDALKDHKDDVRRIGQVWRQQNPSASVEQFINEVGASTMVMLRLDPTPKVNGNGQTTPSGNPAFVPGIGAPPRSAGKNPSGSDNIFTQLNQEFEEDLDDD